MLCRREKESPSLQFRADRIFHATGGWYFHTREEIDVGPYTSRLDAEAEASLLKTLLRRLDSSHTIEVIRAFVTDSDSLQLLRNTASYL